MSHLMKSQLEKHVQVLERKMEGDDVTALGKELDSASAYLKVVTDGRVRRTLENRIATLQDKIKNNQPDKGLIKIRDNAVMLIKLMDSHPNYVKKSRKPRKKSK